MRIEQKHELGRAEAIKRIDGFLDELIGRQPPAGITIRDARKSWTGDRMDFSLSAGKGLFGADLSGNLVVTDDTVVLESDLPILVKSFVGEETVRDVIGRELGKVLAR